MLDIRMNASVTCTDGDAGHVQALVVDPVKKALTHIAVGKHESDQWSQHLVQIDVVKEARKNHAVLRPFPVP